MKTATGAGTAEVTVLIATYNRADLLARTLDSLAATVCKVPWDVVIVDNNSSDHTRAVVEARARAYPVPLRYLFEPRQGKSVALNAALASIRSPFIAFTDDDVRVAPDWLEQSVAPLCQRSDIDYTGGRVLPLWDRPKPGWLDEGGNLGGTIAVKDHGNAAFIFEEQRRTPVGVNMALRRSILDRVGLFREDLGRRGGSLLGQEQAEFFFRCRDAGIRGLYVPDAVVHHFIPASRLTRRYFRRWWFWKGVSQSRLHRLHGTTELGVDLGQATHWLGVPRYLYRTAATHLSEWLRALAAGEPRARVEHEMRFWWVAGYCWDRWTRSRPGTHGGRTDAAPSSVASPRASR